MELLEKKKRAAAIAVSLYLQAEEENIENGDSIDNWSKMGMNRRINDKKFLFRNGRTIGVRIF